MYYMYYIYIYRELCVRMSIYNISDTYNIKLYIYIYMYLYRYIYIYTYIHIYICIFVFMIS